MNSLYEFIRFSRDNLVARILLIFLLMMPLLLIVEQIIEYALTRRPQLAFISQMSAFYVSAVLLSVGLSMIIGWLFSNRR